MNEIYVSYIDESPRLRNGMIDTTHDILVAELRKAFPAWIGFINKYEAYSLGITIITRDFNEEVIVKGPGVYRKSQDVDFTIFVPKDIKNLKKESYEDSCLYLDWIFQGLKIALARYGVTDKELEEIKAGCKKSIPIN